MWIRSILKRWLGVTKLEAAVADLEVYADSLEKHIMMLDRIVKGLEEESAYRENRELEQNERS
jgi:hypothetical protein